VGNTAQGTTLRRLVPDEQVDSHGASSSTAPHPLCAGSDPKAPPADPKSPPDNTWVSAEGRHGITTSISPDRIGDGGNTADGNTQDGNTTTLAPQDGNPIPPPSIPPPPALPPGTDPAHLADYAAGPYTTNHRAALYRDRCGKPTENAYTASSKQKWTPNTWPSHGSGKKWEPKTFSKPWAKKWEQTPTWKPWTPKGEQPPPKTLGYPQTNANLSRTKRKWVWTPNSTHEDDNWKTSANNSANNKRPLDKDAWKMYDNTTTTIYDNNGRNVRQRTHENDRQTYGTRHGETASDKTQREMQQPKP